MGQTPRSRSHGKKQGYPQKGLITMNSHVKYQSSSTHCPKFISKVKVFKKRVKLQGQGHRVKNNGTHGKVLSQEIFMWNITSIAITVQKLLARFKFQRRGQNERITEWQNDRQDKNNMPSDLRSRGHKNIQSALKIQFNT